MSLKVAIAGGGIGGFAAAQALSFSGQQVELFEKEPAFSEIGAGIQLGPNIFRMFDYLGLTDAVNKVSFFPAGFFLPAGPWCLSEPFVMAASPA